MTDEALHFAEDSDADRCKFGTLFYRITVPTTTAKKTTIVSPSAATAVSGEHYIFDAPKLIFFSTR